MKTAWFNDHILPDAMLNSGFKPLEYSAHFEALSQCFMKVEGKKLLDLGCGIAEVSRVFKQFDYVGADLPHMIEKGAKKKNPHANFRYFNTADNDYAFLGDYDIVLMNSFVSELPDWYRVLSNVLANSKKFVIIHRQETTSGESRLEEYETYGGLITTKTIINHHQLMRIFEMNEYKVLHECDSFPNDPSQETFLLARGSE